MTAEQSTIVAASCSDFDSIVIIARSLLFIIRLITAVVITTTATIASGAAIARLHR